MRTMLAAVLAVAALALSGCGYNDIQRDDEQIKASWSEVLNQYQRRADLIPNLVNTVKGFAQQEQEVLTQVTEARARVGSIQATPETDQRSGGVRKVPAGAGRAVERAVAPAGGVGELSAAEIGRELPRPAGAARRHREPHHRGAQPLHQVGAGIQHAGPHVPDQPDRDDVQLQGQAEFHGREREGEIAKPPTVDFDKPAAAPAIAGACQRQSTRPRCADPAAHSAVACCWRARAAACDRAARRCADVPRCRRSRRASPTSPAR